jgi:type VI secretion system secreted protein VgrG
MSISDPLRYFIEIGGQIHEARELSGTEKVSTPFWLTARFFVSASTDIDLEGLVKGAAGVLLMRDDRLVRRIDGVATAISLSASVRGAHELDICIEPRLSLARHRSDMRVFRDMTAPDIITDTLSQIGVKPVLRLSSSYKNRPYCVQMRETDLDFVHRLLEDEGIFYFFLEGDVLVLGDNPGAYEPISGSTKIPYRAGTGMDRNLDAVTEIGHHASLTVGKVSLRDWNPEHPSLSMDVSVEGPTPAGPEYYDYPGEYEMPSEGARKAKLHGESFATGASAFRGRSTSGRLAAGHTWTLDGAPVATYDRGYVISTIEHAYDRQQNGFSVTFEAAPDDAALRPLRVTDVPRLLNPMSGFVTGPAGEDDIHTDEHGRVKVHFHWDRRLPPDDDCSHWIPVLQDNTGHSSAIPRRGWEVLVHFMEGDPDRPVVLGRIYNAEDVFPVPLPARKFCTSLKSLSTPTRDGTNEIQLDDEAGREYVMIHAERDQDIVIANDKTERILVNDSSLVRRDETVEIGASHTLHVGHDMIQQVGCNQTWSVEGDRKRKTAEAESASIGNNRSVSIGGSHLFEVEDSSAVTARNLCEQVGGVVLEVTNKSNATQAGTNGARLVGGASIEIATEDHVETAVKKRIETVGGVLFQRAKEEHKIKAGKARSTTVGGMLVVNSRKQLSVTGAERLTMRSATAAHEATKTVTLKVQGSTVVLGDGLVKLETSGQILLKVTGENSQGSKKSEQI